MLHVLAICITIWVKVNNKKWNNSECWWKSTCFSLLLSKITCAMQTYGWRTAPWELLGKGDTGKVSFSSRRFSTCSASGAHCVCSADSADAVRAVETTLRHVPPFLLHLCRAAAMGSSSQPCREGAPTTCPCVSLSHWSTLYLQFLNASWCLG